MDKYTVNCLYILHTANIRLMKCIDNARNLLETGNLAAVHSLNPSLHVPIIAKKVVQCGRLHDCNTIGDYYTA